MEYNTHNTDTFIDREKINKYNSLEKEKVFLSEKEIPEFVNALKTKENLFLDFIKIGNRKIEANIGEIKILENIKYIEILYPKIIQSLAENGETLQFNFKNVKGLDLLNPLWKINSSENKILIPLSEFAEKKIMINLPILNKQESDDYFWIGWSPANGEIQSLDSLIEDLNGMDLNSKKILFSFNENDDDYIDDVFFSKIGNRIKIIFSKNKNAEFVKEDNLVITNLKNFIGIENFEIKEELKNQLKDPTLTKVEKFLKQFDQYSLSKKFSFFNSKTTNDSNPINAIESIDFQTIHSEKERTMMISFNITLKENYVWKDGIQNNLGIVVNFDDAIESNISVLKTQSLIQPKIDIIKLQQFIDKNEISTVEILTEKLIKIAPENKINFLNWKIDDIKNEVIKDIVISFVNNNVQIQINLNLGYKWVNNEFDGLLRTSKYKLKVKPQLDISKIKPIDKKIENNISAPFNEVQTHPTEMSYISNSNTTIIISLVSTLIAFIIGIISWLLYKVKFKKTKNKQSKFKE